jgi:hypothetical protein
MNYFSVDKLNLDRAGNIIIIGGKNTDKYLLLKNILHHHKEYNNGEVITNMRNTDNLYGQFFKVHNNYSRDIVSNFFKLL